MSFSIEDIYRQDMITNNYTSNMLEGIMDSSSSGNNENSIAGILGGLAAGNSLTGLDGMGLDTSSLLGNSLLGGITQTGTVSFANILDKYLQAETVANNSEASKWADTLADVLEEVEQTGDHSKSTKTVQELYEYFQDKMASGANGFSSLVQAAKGASSDGGSSSSQSGGLSGGQSVSQFQMSVPDVEGQIPDFASIESDIESSIEGMLHL